MINPIEQFEFLEKQSKSPVGIMVILSYTVLALGLLMMYASTMDIIVKNKLGFGIGGGLVILSLFLLYIAFRAAFTKETLSSHQKLVSTTFQILKDELDLSMKLIEYNEKAITYNEKYKEPKMQIRTDADLAKSVELHFDTRSTIFKKS